MSSITIAAWSACHTPAVRQGGGREAGWVGLKTMLTESPPPWRVCVGRVSVDVTVVFGDISLIAWRNIMLPQHRSPGERLSLKPKCTRHDNDSGYEFLALGTWQTQKASCSKESSVSGAFLSRAPPPRVSGVAYNAPGTPVRVYYFSPVRRYAQKR